jgi:hypothetical protein
MTSMLTRYGTTVRRLTAGGNPGGAVFRVANVAAAAALAGSGFIHAQLYLDGYRFIHVVGVLFLLQAAVSFAFSLLLLASVVARPPLLIRLAAAGATLGALAGFVASRTVGVFGFTEHGLQPAPQAILSILTEVAVLLLLAAAGLPALRRPRRCSPAAGRRKSRATATILRREGGLTDEHGRPTVLDHA